MPRIVARQPGAETHLGAGLRCSINEAAIGHDQYAVGAFGNTRVVRNNYNGSFEVHSDLKKGVHY